MLKKLEAYPSYERVVEMLDYWLKNHKSKPTWKDVAKVLSDIGMHQLAESILNVYKTGETFCAC